MLDPRLLSERHDEIAESCRRRGVEVDLAAAVAAHAAVNEAKAALEECSRRRNEHQAQGKKLPPEERKAHGLAGRALKEEAARLEQDVTTAEQALDEWMQRIPNFVHPDVPVGGEEDFNELRRVGTPREFDFEPLDHLALGDAHELLDFESAARVTGQKFYYLKNEAVLLELGLIRFAVETAREAGYAPHATPDLARASVVDKLAFSPRGEETQIYSVTDTDLDLVGTAEITLGGLGMDQIFDEASLPLRLGGISHCFRTEAGSHGRESRGLYRVHQFSKVELFAFCTPDQSEAVHQEMLEIEERIMQALDVPYRVIDVASGDLGAPAYRKYDIEAWMPGRGDYGEVTSTSNCLDFQARRLRARYRRSDAKRNALTHTLNGTAVAVPRVLVALLENHQQADGSVVIPKALQPYVGFDRIGGR